MVENRPFIIRNLLDQKTREPRERKIYFDAVYPVKHYDGTISDRGEGLHIETGNTTIIPAIELFIIRQLWPKKYFPSEEFAMQALYPSIQEALFGGIS
jgi:hypothetical protein